MKKADVIMDNGGLVDETIIEDTPKFNYVRDEAKFLLNMDHGNFEVIYVVNNLIHIPTSDNMLVYSVWFSGKYFDTDIHGFVVFCTSIEKTPADVSNEVINYIRQKFPIESEVDFGVAKTVNAIN